MDNNSLLSPYRATYSRRDAADKNNLLSPFQGSSRKPLGGGVAGNNDDSNPIQEFVRLHMMSILHPFAEHVRELQSQMGDLSDRTSKTCLEVDQQKTKLHHHEAQLSATFSNIKESKEKAEVLRKDFDVARGELSEVQTAHRATSSSLAKAETKIDLTASEVDAMKQQLKDTGTKVGALLTTSAELAKRLEEDVEKRFDKMENLYKEVHDQQFDLQKAFQQANAFAGSTAQKVDTLARACMLRREEDAASFAAGVERADAFEQRLHEANMGLLRHTDSLSSLSEGLESVKKETLQLVTPKQLQVHLDEIRVSIGDLEQRAQKSEDSITDIVFDATADKRTLEASIGKVDKKKREEHVGHLASGGDTAAS